MEGPAKVPHVVEKFSAEGKKDGEGVCHPVGVLRRKGRLLVNHKKSEVAIVVQVGEDEDEDGELLNADIVMAMHACTVEYTGAGMALDASRLP